MRLLLKYKIAYFSKSLYLDFCKRRSMISLVFCLIFLGLYKLCWLFMLSSAYRYKMSDSRSFYRASSGIPGWGSLIKTFSSTASSKIQLMHAPSKAQKARAWRHASYSCNKPFFGKYDFSCFRQFKFVLLAWFLGLMGVGWIAYESVRGLLFFL